MRVSHIYEKCIFMPVVRARIIKRPFLVEGNAATPMPHALREERRIMLAPHQRLLSLNCKPGKMRSRTSDKL